MWKWKWGWRWNNESKQNKNNKIIKKNYYLDKLIDKSKSFEDQIELLKKEKI